jgi:hypothetical protein
VLVQRSHSSFAQVYRLFFFAVLSVTLALTFRKTCPVTSALGRKPTLAACHPLDLRATFGRGQKLAFNAWVKQRRSRLS